MSSLEVRKVLWPQFRYSFQQIFIRVLRKCLIHGNDCNVDVSLALCDGVLSLQLRSFSIEQREKIDNAFPVPEARNVRSTLTLAGLVVQFY